MIKNLSDVEAKLKSIPADASPAKKWQALRTVTRGLLRTYGVPNAAAWMIKALPPQAYTRYGDCAYWTRVIRYRNSLVKDWRAEQLAATVIHEASHAITYTELKRQGKRGTGGHGSMWRGTAAALGLPGAQAHNLPD